MKPVVGAGSGHGLTRSFLAFLSASCRGSETILSGLKALSLFPLRTPPLWCSRLLRSFALSCFSSTVLFARWFGCFSFSFSSSSLFSVSSFSPSSPCWQDLSTTRHVGDRERSLRDATDSAAAFCSVTPTPPTPPPPPPIPTTTQSSSAFPC